ncbi:MAG: hypothetical protein A4E32_00441 [Methanomassiliicoccales archaeon PtaU1.Bin124]|nr:MAG: hypothetical protein A4E32_00441 [Methanomassiliicoccales archaeon PtaU1.Bin124]
MTVYIAMLRGINVGSHNRLSMTDLRKTLTELGLEDVQTYIQSGNAVFRSEEDEAVLDEKIERALKTKLGIDAPVVLRTLPELQILLESKIAPEEQLYAMLLVGQPNDDTAEYLDRNRSDEERFEIDGRDIVLVLPNGVHASPLAKGVDKLGVVGTMRNWRTLHQLETMASALE